MINILTISKVIEYNFVHGLFLLKVKIQSYNFIGKKPIPTINVPKTTRYYNI